jgi:hypothetical protein
LHQLVEGQQGHCPVSKHGVGLLDVPTSLCVPHEGVGRGELPDVSHTPQQVWSGDGDDRDECDQNAQHRGQLVDPVVRFHPVVDERIAAGTLEAVGEGGKARKRS